MYETDPKKAEKLYHSLTTSGTLPYNTGTHKLWKEITKLTAVSPEPANEIPHSYIHVVPVIEHMGTENDLPTPMKSSE